MQNISNEVSKNIMSKVPICEGCGGSRWKTKVKGEQYECRLCQGKGSERLSTPTTPREQMQCRYAPSLGALEGTPEEAWGTLPYTDRAKDAVFFGLYDLRDYIALWRHKGKRYILWAGDDLENFKNGFLLNNGKLKWLSKIFRGWFRGALKKLLQKCIHYVENVDQAIKLNPLNLEVEVVPSFMGNVEDFPISYKHADRPNVYISVHPGREAEYGFNVVQELAQRLPGCNFHIYGMKLVGTQGKNITYHGQVPKEQMNEEIKEFQCGLRLNESDGFSEITAKSVLMGQYPLTFIENTLIPSFKTIDDLVALLKCLPAMKEPNFKAQMYYAININNYPWNSKK